MLAWGNSGGEMKKEINVSVFMIHGYSMLGTYCLFGTRGLGYLALGWAVIIFLLGWFTSPSIFSDYYRKVRKNETR